MQYLSAAVPNAAAEGEVDEATRTSPTSTTTSEESCISSDSGYCDSDVAFPTISKVQYTRIRGVLSGLSIYWLQMVLVVDITE